MKAIKRCFSALLVFVFLVCSLGVTVFAEEFKSSDNLPLYQEVPAAQPLSTNGPYITVNVYNTYTTRTTAAGVVQYKYNVEVVSHAGDLGMIAGTKVSDLYVMTGPGGSTILHLSGNSLEQYYSGTSLNYHVVGTFYRSINNPIASVYVITEGAKVYDYTKGWFSADNFIGTVVLHTPSACLADR